MRRRLSVLAGSAILAFAVVGCEGPAGPQGPEGPAGPAGPAGPTGPAGPSATATCTECHTSDTQLFAREIEYENSVHYLGGNFERSTTDCAPCHTHEGFVERIATGAETTAEDIQNPSPINCRTCHQIHTTYTDADYALTTTAPVQLWAVNGTVDFGKGNLCAQCHQARPLSAAETPTLNGDSVTVSSSRYGWHHGPQAEVLGGLAGFRFSGSMTITEGPSAHGYDSNGCPQCHMATPYGAQAGGHTWNMTYTLHGAVDDNVAGCKACHNTITDFDFLGFKAHMEVQMDSLSTLLQEIGILSASGSVNTGKWPANVAAAMLNYDLINSDGSMGIHNPPYTGPLIENTIEAMTPLAAAAVGGN